MRYYSIRSFGVRNGWSGPKKMEKNNREQKSWARLFRAYTEGEWPEVGISYMTSCAHFGSKKGTSGVHERVYFFRPIPWRAIEKEWKNSSRASPYTGYFLKIPSP